MAYDHYLLLFTTWMTKDLKIDDTNDRVRSDPDVGRRDGILYLIPSGAFPTRTKTKAEAFSLFTTPKEIMEEPARNQEQPGATRQSAVTNVFFGTDKIGLPLKERPSLHDRV